MEQTHFGRYVIVAELGRGAMGAVHRASDPLIERDVAIKTLLPNLPPEIMDEVRERFLREARSADRLNHPNIVTIYDVGEQDGVAYIAMELLEGKSLQQILRDTPRLPIATIVELVAQVADSLDERLRAAFRYLSEFATVLNEASPVSDGKQGVMFFGDRSGMILGDGFTDMRTRDLVNIRHHGQAKLHFGPEKLDDDVLDEFGTWVLGADDAFERFLKRRT